MNVVEANMPMGKQVSKPSSPGDSGIPGALASVGAAAGTGALVKKSVKTLNPAARLVPGAMSGMSIYDAIDRWKQGDRTGSVISVLAAAGYIVPGPMGWTLGGAADALNIGRDIGSGKYDPLAQAAKDFVNEENKFMNNAEHIKILRDKLSKIDEGPAGAVANAAFKGGTKGASAADDALRTSSKIEVPTQVGSGPRDPGQQARMKAAASDDIITNRQTDPFNAGPRRDPLSGGPRTADTATAVPGQSVASGSKGGSVGRAAGAAAAVGAAGLAGYMATRGGGPNPPAPGPGPRPGGDGNTPTPGSSSLSAEEEQELALLADKLSKHMGRNPDLDNLLLRHTKLRGNGGIPTP